MINQMNIHATDDHSEEWAKIQIDSYNQFIEINTNGGSFRIPMGAGRPLLECLQKAFPET